MLSSLCFIISLQLQSRVVTVSIHRKPSLPIHQDPSFTKKIDFLQWSCIFCVCT